MLEHILTRADALAMLKRAPSGSRFLVAVRAELPIVDNPTRCFPGFACVSVSRAEAIKVANDLLSETLEQRGARLSIRELTEVLNLISGAADLPSSN